MLHIRSAHHVSDHRIWVSFDDGTEGEVNLVDVLEGEVFEPLKNLEVFAKVSVDPELETVVWPNGADFAPEFIKALHDEQSQADA